MKLLNIVQNLVHGLQNALKRFPVTIAVTVSMTSLFIIANHNTGQNLLSSQSIDTLLHSGMILAMGIPISLCIYLYFEKNNIQNFKLKAISFTASGVLLILYQYFFLTNFDTTTMTRYFSITAALCLVFTYITYFYRREGFELYIVRLLSRVFTTILFSAIINLGIFAILFTISKLFTVTFSETIYADISITIAGIFAPLFFIAGIPECSQTMSVDDYPKLLKLLLMYIAIPLLSIYTLILYVYFGKVILTLQWPLQLVMHLVFWYSLISIAVIFLVAPLHQSYKWLNRFDTIYIKAMIPPLIMLYIAMTKRLALYAVTERRYFVIVFSLWFLGVLIYLNVSRKKIRLLLPLSLSILLVLSVVGPWDCYSISKYTQNKRFVSILTQNNMLESESTNKIKANSSISDKYKRELTNIITYFNTNHKLNELKVLPQNFSTSDMKKVFGFNYSEYAYNYPINNSFYYNTNYIAIPIDISDYTYLFDFREKTITDAPVVQGIQCSYDTNNNMLTIKKNNTIIYEKTISEYVEKLYKKYGTNVNEIKNIEDMTFKESNKYVDIKIIFQNTNGYNDMDTNTTHVDYSAFYLFLKVK